jgi:excisionase family DNA binding protein
MATRVLRPNEAAERLGLSVETISSRRWRQRRGLRGIKLGAALRFHERDVADFIRRCREVAGARSR